MLESIAVIFSLLSVWFTSKENKLCWPVGILGVIGFMIIFYQTKDWGNFFLQFVFLFFHVTYHNNPGHRALEFLQTLL